MILKYDNDELNIHRILILNNYREINLVYDDRICFVAADDREETVLNFFGDKDLVKFIHDIIFENLTENSRSVSLTIYPVKKVGLGIVTENGRVLPGKCIWNAATQNKDKDHE